MVIMTKAFSDRVIAVGPAIISAHPHGTLCVVVDRFETVIAEALGIGWLMFEVVHG